MDLSIALDLKKYFHDKALNKEMLDKKYIKEIKEPYLQFFHDDNLKKNFTLAENIILMAFGQISRSFLTFFGNKDSSSYKSEDYIN